MILNRRKFIFISLINLITFNTSKSHSEVKADLTLNNKIRLGKGNISHLAELKSFNYHLKENIYDSFPLWDFTSGMSNFQYHAFDEINGHLYTLQHSSTNGKGGKISRFPMANNGKVKAIDSQDYCHSVGHQMLSVENLKNGTVKLWSAKGIYSSLSVIRFDYCPNESPKNIEEFIVFNPEEFGKFYPTGNLSYDQKWLIVRGKSKMNSSYKGYNCIAVFQVEKLINNKEREAWHLAEYVWPYEFYDNDPKSNNNPQSIVCDGNHIFLIFGPREIDKQNIIKKYTLTGDIVAPEANLNIGIKEAKELSDGTSNEIEGAQFLKVNKNTPPALTLGYVRGGPVFYKGIELVPY